jgi:hypothetical protein
MRKIAPLFDNGNSLWHDAQGIKFNKNMDDERINRIAGEFRKRVVNLDKLLDQGIGDIGVPSPQKGYRR